MQKIVIATGNAGKLKELRELLADLPVELISQRDLNITDADETGLSFVENAILKARHAAAASGLPALADDSGLAVDVLGGAPGIYSARYAGPGANDAGNNAKLLQELLPHRGAGTIKARFICVLAFLRHAEDPTPIICEGVWEGEILEAPRGGSGFGYDPLFWVAGQGCSSAELPAAVKNNLSHRGQALALLKARLATIIGQGGRA
jgi:XTP/dITP diphosphohydrolase